MDDQLYEINIKRFIQSTEYQLKKLNDCITKLNDHYEDWKNVRQAHQNAIQIIKRIKSDIKEIEKIRKQIVSQLNDKSSNQIVNTIDEQLKEISKKLKKETDEIEGISAPYHRFELRNQDFILESNFATPELFQFQLKRNDYIAQDKDLCNSYEQLQKDCEDLKYLMETFHNELFKQKPSIDSIERNVLETDVNIVSGASSLRQALSYKTLGTATGGALIGTLVGGPIGFVAGAKLGALAGLGGGFLGYLAGKYVNKPT